MVEFRAGGAFIDGRRAVGIGETVLAKTMTREESSALPVSVTSAELTQLGARVDGAFTAEDRAMIFQRIAPACTDPRDQWLYLTKCLANGLSPFKGELYAIPRKVKSRDSDRYYTVITYVTSYHVFVSRARQAGFVVKGECVCEKDEWGGWDAVNDRPVKHIIKDANRGPIIGAYAVATPMKGGPMVSGWWPWEELAINSRSNPMFAKMPEHMTKRVAILRVARLVAPDLSSLYGAEEFGVTLGAEVPKEVRSISADPVEQIQAQLDPEVVHPDDTAGDDAIDVSAPQEPARISDGQRRTLVEQLSEGGYKTQGDALGFLSKVLERDVASTAHLNVEELERVCSVLRGEDDDA